MDRFPTTVDDQGVLAVIDPRHPQPAADRALACRGHPAARRERLRLMGERVLAPVASRGDGSCSSTPAGGARATAPRWTPSWTTPGRPSGRRRLYAARSARMCGEGGRPGSEASVALSGGGDLDRHRDGRAPPARAARLARLPRGDAATGRARRRRRHRRRHRDRPWAWAHAGDTRAPGARDRGRGTRVDIALLAASSARTARSPAPRARLPRSRRWRSAWRSCARAWRSGSAVAAAGWRCSSRSRRAWLVAGATWTGVGLWCLVTDSTRDPTTGVPA